MAQLPELAQLRDNWQVMRDEALALMGEGQIRAATGHNDLGFNSFFKEGWKRFYLKWYGAPLPSAQALCPKTVALVESLPSVNAAMFALLPPGGKLNRHRDPFAGSLRYHLGLSTPNSDACRIFIDGEPYSWRDGEDVLFDETFIHSAENKTDVHAHHPVLRRRAAAAHALDDRVQPLGGTPRHPRLRDPERRDRGGRRIQPRLRPARLPAAIC